MGVFLFLFISFCYSLFCGGVSFSLYHFIFLFLFSVLSLLFLFYLGGSLVLVQVKQVRGFYRVFIIKIGGGGVCAIMNKRIK